MYGSISPVPWPMELCVRWNVPDALDDGGWMKPYVDAEALSGSEDLRRSARGPPTALYSGPLLLRRRWRRRRKEKDKEKDKGKSGRSEGEAEDDQLNTNTS